MQGNQVIITYISQFEKFSMRCENNEELAITLSQFWSGLWDDIQWEICLWEITTLQQAYQLAWDLEHFSLSSLQHSISSSHSPLVSISQRSPKLPNNNMNPDLPQNIPNNSSTSSTIVLPPIDHEKKPITLDSFNKTTCFRYDGHDDWAFQCSTCTLHLIEQEENLFNEDQNLFDVEECNTAEWLAQEFHVESTVLDIHDQDTTLGVMRCVLTQPHSPQDKDQMSIFYSFIKIGGKACKVIVDSSSSINAISLNSISRLDFSTIDHSHPYKVLWVDSSSADVQKQCWVPLKLHLYEDDIWCDILPMEVSRMSIVIWSGCHSTWTI